MGNNLGSTCSQATPAACSEELSAVRQACEYLVTPAETSYSLGGQPIYHVGRGENINDLNNPRKRRKHGPGDASTGSTRTCTTRNGDDESLFQVSEDEDEEGLQSDDEQEEVGPTSFQSLPGLDGSRYRGYATENGMRHGEGLLVFADGVTLYQGQWCKGAMHGYGRFEDPESRFEGHWEHDHKHGHGRQVWLDEEGMVYEGDYNFGKIEGLGRCSWADGSTYDGYFKENQIEGHGKLTEEDSVYVGQFVGGVKEGEGTFTWSDGRAYEGQFSDDSKHGFGTMKWREDGYVYSGMWKNGYRHGRAKVSWPDGREQEAEFANDRPLKILKRRTKKTQEGGILKTGKTNNGDDAASVCCTEEADNAGADTALHEMVGNHSVGDDMDKNGNENKNEKRHSVKFRQPLNSGSSSSGESSGRRSDGLPSVRGFAPATSHNAPDTGAFLRPAPGREI